MTGKVPKSWLWRALILFEVVLLFLFLYWRLRLGVTRYFDIDEFAHLHWGYNFFSGFRPYSDFLYFFPPFSLIILYPLFLFVGKNVSILIAARIFQFFIFLALIGVLYLLARKVRDGKVALLTILILSFLPLPYDKFLEIRPDTLATVFALAGTYFLIRGINPPSPRLWRTREIGVWFLSGLFYSLGIVTVPKVVFFLPAVFVVMLLIVVKSRPKASTIGRWTFGPDRPLDELKLLKELKQNVVIFGVGLVMPLIATALFFTHSGDFPKALYLSTIFASSSSKVLGSKFYMFPSHFFHPNDTYYAESGVSLSLFLNLSIYLIAIIWGIVRLVSFLDKKTFQDSLVELLIALSFLVNLIVFIKFIPLKHAQYFIIFSPFVAFYFADFIFTVLHPRGVMNLHPWGETKLVTRGIRELSGWIFLVIILILIGWKGYTMYKIKSAWTNQKTLDQLEAVYKTIPFDQYVFDLYGQTIFYKDPYYVCCLPYGQYLEAFNFKLPSLSKALESTKTKYIFVENEGRLSVLPPVDAKFIREHYKQSNFTPTVWVVKGE